MKVLLFNNLKSSADYHRIDTPFRYLAMEDGETFKQVITGTELKIKEFQDTDVIVINRHPTFDPKAILDLRKKNGCKLWVDLDDYWNLYSGHYLYKEFAANKDKQKILDYLRAADVVTTPSETLRDEILTYNKNVVVVPNALPFGHEQFRPDDKIESDKVRYIYVGGASHVYDLGTILTTFQSLGYEKIFQDSSEWILAGDPGEPENKLWRNMVEVMNRMSNFKTRRVLPLRTYMEHYNHADISIAPLLDNDFNKCKSNLKTIEAGCMGLPLIASDVFPYKQDKGVMGLTLCRNSYDWGNAFRKYLNNPRKITEDGLALHEYCKEHYDLEKVNKIRRQILNSLKS